jgi:hypothetical protein
MGDQPSRDGTAKTGNLGTVLSPGAAHLHKQLDKNEQEPGSPDIAPIAQAMPLDRRDGDLRDAGLRIVSESMEMHCVKRVEFAIYGETAPSEKRDSIVAAGMRRRTSFPTPQHFQQSDK